VATLLHGGRTLTTYEIVITDEQGRRVCTCRLTCLLRDVIPGDGHPFTGRV
jgi:acyl-coenzyme A thioesterase PaaI-like protein